MLNIRVFSVYFTKIAQKKFLQFGKRAYFCPGISYSVDNCEKIKQNILIQLENQEKSQIT